MADTAGYLIRDLLTPLWRAEQEPVVSVDRRIKKADLPLFRALAEEYAALVYVNFLQSVLLQMRTLVICAAGMYVFILCSISVYPFEPHPALQVLAVALLVAMGAMVGFVYAEMHRDSWPIDLHQRRRTWLGFLVEIYFGRRGSSVQPACGAVSGNWQVPLFLAAAVVAIGEVTWFEFISAPPVFSWCSGAGRARKDAGRR